MLTILCICTYTCIVCTCLSFSNVCMYVCVYLCVCMCVCTCVCMSFCLSACLHICLSVCPSQLCEDYLVETLDSNNACDRIQAAQTYRLDDLKRKTLEYIEENTKVLCLLVPWGETNRNSRIQAALTYCLDDLKKKLWSRLKITWMYCVGGGEGQGYGGRAVTGFRLNRAPASLTSRKKKSALNRIQR